MWVPPLGLAPISRTRNPLFPIFVLATGTDLWHILWTRWEYPFNGNIFILLIYKSLTYSTALWWDCHHSQHIFCVLLLLYTQELLLFFYRILEVHLQELSSEYSVNKSSFPYYISADGEESQSNMCQTSVAFRTKIMKCMPFPRCIMCFRHFLHLPFEKCLEKEAWPSIVLKCAKFIEDMCHTVYVLQLWGWKKKRNVSNNELCQIYYALFINLAQMMSFSLTLICMHPMYKKIQVQYILFLSWGHTSSVNTNRTGLEKMVSLAMGILLSQLSI